MDGCIHASMRCPICEKEVSKDIYMHACMYACRLRDGRHLALALQLLKKEQEGSLVKLKEVENAISDKEVGVGRNGTGNQRL
jgi:hypothetical protein